MCTLLNQCVSLLTRKSQLPGKKKEVMEILTIVCSPIIVLLP